MMHLLHRTIPFIAVAALVTVSPAGAQERDDSTSTASALVSLLGLGGHFVGFRGTDSDAAHPTAWNCAGGCASFGARRFPAVPFAAASFGAAPFGAMVSAGRASSYGASGAKSRSAFLPTDRADLSDYGWSRRVDADGTPLDRLPMAAAPASAGELATLAAEPAGPVPAPVSDGAGRAPAWVAPGSSPEAAAAAWNDEPLPPTSAAAAARDGGRGSMPTVTNVPDDAITSFADAFDAAPLMTTVPEPSTVVLLAVGLSSLLFLRRRSARGR